MVIRCVITWKYAGKLLVHTSPYLRLLIVKIKARLLVITGEVFVVSLTQ